MGLIVGSVQGRAGKVRGTMPRPAIKGKVADGPSGPGTDEACGGGKRAAQDMAAGMLMLLATTLRGLVCARWHGGGGLLPGRLPPPGGARATRTAAGCHSGRVSAS